MGCLTFTYDGLQGTPQNMRYFSCKKPSIVPVKVLWKDISRIEFSGCEELILLHVILAQCETKKKNEICYSFDGTYVNFTDLVAILRKYSSKLSGKSVPLNFFNRSVGCAQRTNFNTIIVWCAMRTLYVIRL